MPERWEPGERRVLVGVAGSGRSTALLARYRALLEAGVPSDRVLVWLPNGRAVERWRLAIRSWPLATGALRVGTFRSFVRAELAANWLRVQPGWKAIAPEGAAFPPDPRWVGSRVAQQVMRQAAEERPDPGAEVESRGPLMGYDVMQWLDAYARAVEAGIDPLAIAARLEAAGGGSAEQRELHTTLQRNVLAYREACFSRGVFDHAAQLELFDRALLPDAAYRERLAGRFDHLLVDQAEELIPVAQRALFFLEERASSVVLARDLNGPLRAYLGADAGALDAAVLERRDRFQAALYERPAEREAGGQAAFGNALGRLVLAETAAELGADEGLAPPSPVYAPAVHVEPPALLRLDMLDRAVALVSGALAAGVAPSGIVLVAPVVDPLLAWHGRSRLAELDVLVRVGSGSSRVLDHRSVRTLVTLARLARPAWGVPPRAQDVLEVLETLLDLHPLEAPVLAAAVYAEEGALAPASALAANRHLARFEAPYGELVGWVEEARGSSLPLAELLASAFGALYAPSRLRHLAPDPEVARASVPSPYHWDLDAAFEVLQVEQLVAGAREHAEASRALGLDEAVASRRFLRSIFAGELAEKPLVPPGALPAAVTITTAAQYAMEGERAALQIWLDTTHPGWRKSDVRPAYNPRVLSGSWQPGQPYTHADDVRHQGEKLAATLHTIALKATGPVHLLASEYGPDGTELAFELHAWASECLRRRP